MTMGPIYIIEQTNSDGDRRVMERYCTTREAAERYKSELEGYSIEAATGRQRELYAHNVKSHRATLDYLMQSNNVRDARWQKQVSDCEKRIEECERIAQMLFPTGWERFKREFEIIEVKPFEG
jgi:hypothetical protein